MRQLVRPSSPHRPCPLADSNGFSDTNATGRHVFPLTGTAPISILSAHEQWQFGVVISNRSNPTSFADFNGTSGYNYVLPFRTSTALTCPRQDALTGCRTVTDRGEGNFCFEVDMSAVSSALNLANGSLATIQAIFNGPSVRASVLRSDTDEMQAATACSTSVPI